MKRVFFCIGVVAIFFIASFNFYLSLNSESKDKVVFGNMLSVAQNESGVSGYCDYDSYEVTYGDCGVVFAYFCTSGSDIYCLHGQSNYPNCSNMDHISNVQAIICVNR